jgi:hypothetical protein
MFLSTLCRLRKRRFVRPFRHVRPATHRPRFELLEDRLAPAVTIWTGADFAHNVNWSNPANWSNGVPQAGDTAQFTNNASVQDFTSNVDAGFNATSAVGALQIDGSWGGTINVNGPLTVSGNFTMYNGSFGGNGAVVIGGNSSQWRRDTQRRWRNSAPAMRIDQVGGSGSSTRPGNQC